MDEHGRPTSSTSSPPSPPSFFSAAGNGGLLEFPYTEVPEQWLMDDDDDDSNIQEQLLSMEPCGGDGGSLSAGSADRSSRNPPAAAATRRGRKAGPSAGGGGPAVSHMEAERHRRDKLHRRFCDLRAAVPNVTRMDKASLLADATAYIAELRARVERLEAEARWAAARKANPFLVADDVAAAASATKFELEEEEEKLEVRMVVGQEAAALRLTTTAARHAPARLMDALRALDLPVQHACACRVGGVTVQDAVVDVPAELREAGCLRAALLHRLQGSG
ncbi:hypothetical protein PAHAL_6G290800 [Panicum hallii]|uniref:Transcription factor n=1 Tax=Panicum hallii TaxID=206008 RepID=A0A2S3I4F6_9POAL|nr:transcription factor bHLH14-like [Panicum hallii]PAN36535.1 hypothetical protein PAHAL_6G290800 [Panicum hallii]